MRKRRTSRRARAGLGALLLAASLATSHGAARGADWQGLVVVSKDARAQEGVVSPEDVCGFATLEFAATVGNDRYEFTLTSNGYSHTFGDNVRGNGGVAEWGRLRIANKTVETKLEGRFSDIAFSGRLYGTFHNPDMRAPGQWTCRADVFMARAPMTPEDVRSAHARLGDGATDSDVLRDVASLVAKPGPVTDARKATPQRPPPADPGTADLRSQLALLKELHDGGLIDNAEFDRRRQALLDGTFGQAREPQIPAAPRFQPPVDVPINIASGTAADPVPRAGSRDLTAGIDWGRYHALVIGINAYEHLPRLETAINDALRVADLLERLYGFEVTKLINPTREQIVDALDNLRETLLGDDNLLIYYAGHGWLDEGADRGYWLPVDAQPNRRGNWVSNATVTDTLKALLAKHVIIVADSCFSGSLTRAAPIQLRTANYWQKIAAKAARVTLTSGGVEPVADNDGSGHSPFASAFIQVLEENDGVLDGTSLFSAMRRPVMLKANQTPEYSDVREAGHDGGDFVFVRQR